MDYHNKVWQNIRRIKQIIRAHNLKSIDYRPFVSGSFASTLGIGITFLKHIILARVMGPSNFGAVTLVLNLVRLPTRIVDLGVVESIPRFIAMSIGVGNEQDAREYAAQSLAFLILVGVFLLSTTYFLYSPLTFVFSNQVASLVVCYSLFFPAVYLKEWCLAVLQGVGNNNKELLLGSFAFNCLTFILSIAAWWLFGSVISVVIAHGLATLLVSVAGTLSAINSLKNISILKQFRGFGLLYEMINHGFPLSLAGVAGRAFRRGDILIVGALLDSSAVGIYKVCYMIPSGLKSLLKPVNSYSLFYMSEKFGEGNRYKMVGIYTLAVSVSQFITFPLTVIFFSYSELFLRVGFGPSYAADFSLMQILLCGFTFFISVGPMGGYFNTIGKTWSRLSLITLLALLNLAFNFYAISLLGKTGAALGTSLSFMCLFALFTLFFWVEEHDFLSVASPLFSISIVLLILLILKILSLPVFLKGTVTVISFFVTSCIPLLVSIYVSNDLT